MALEIGLDKMPNETDVRQNLNLIRTWLNAFCVDGSHSTQFGKMPMVKTNDYLVRRCTRTWYTSIDSSPYDIGLCAYAEVLLLMMEFRKTCGPQQKLEDRYREVSSIDIDIMSPTAF